MLFNFNKGTNLTTFHGDFQFTKKMAALFKIPEDYVFAWSNHYISVEFMSPINLNDQVTVRIYTKQAENPKLPLARTVSDFVTIRDTQHMTPALVVEANGYDVNQFRLDVEKQVLATNFHKPNTIQNINNLQQKTLLTDKRFEVNLTRLTSHEQKIDNHVFKNESTVVQNTAEILNRKQLEKPRVILEKEIIQYDKSDYTHPKNTYDFYQGVRTGLHETIKDPKAPLEIKNKCQRLDFQTQHIANMIKKYYNL